MKIYLFIIFRLSLLLTLGVLDIAYSSSSTVHINCFKYEAEFRYCDINTNDLILAESTNQTFEISGITNEQRENLNGLFFHFSIDFMPKELFSMFPNLEWIAFHQVSLKKIDLPMFENLIKYQNKINNISLRHLQIEMIDPNLMQVFSTIKTISLHNNACINEDFVIKNGDASYLQSKLRTCFANYLNSIHHLRRLIEEDISDIKLRLAKLEATIERLAKH